MYKQADYGAVPTNFSGLQNAIVPKQETIEALISELFGVANSVENTARLVAENVQGIEPEPACTQSGQAIPTVIERLRSLRSILYSADRHLGRSKVALGIQ
jgi:hypothetical protein